MHAVLLHTAITVSPFARCSSPLSLLAPLSLLSYVFCFTSKSEAAELAAESCCVGAGCCLVANYIMKTSATSQMQIVPRPPLKGREVFFLTRCLILSVSLSFPNVRPSGRGASGLNDDGVVVVAAAGGGQLDIHEWLGMHKKIARP